MLKLFSGLMFTVFVVTLLLSCSQNHKVANSKVDLQKAEVRIAKANAGIGDTLKKIVKTKEEWNIKFYKPLFQKTFTHLREGGHYCLNVPEEIYKDCCIPILGKCSFKILLKKEDRQIESKKNEFR